jgi:hypothetical protein
MKLIETKTLGAAAASIEFTSIPQDFTDLVVFFSGRSNTAGGSYTAHFLRFNGATTNLSMIRLYGNGSVAGTDTDTKIVLTTPRGGSTANTFSSNSVYITDYAGSTAKSVSINQATENNAAEVLLDITAGLWSNTAAITTLTIVADSTFVLGSTASLYGVLKGSDGIVTTS